MSPKYVRRVMRQAGFPLRKLGAYRSRYASSVVEIEFLHFPDESAVRVWFLARDKLNWRLSASFESPTRALAFIHARLSMRYVPGADLFLRRDVPRSFRLIEGGAA